MKIKTSELAGPALDWAVAKCEGYEARVRGATNGVQYIQAQHPLFGWADWGPSTDWSQGGPIIEREEINTNIGGQWVATMVRPGTSYRGHGPTPLIAAMRCYVASKLGDEVEIPEELK
jgi:hypothetical protein